MLDRLTQFHYEAMCRSFNAGNISSARWHWARYLELKVA